MSTLVALETKLSVTIERIVRILAAEDTVWATAFIGAFSSHVAKLFAITTLDSDVVLGIVTCYLVFHASIPIILALDIFLPSLLHRIHCLTIRVARLFLIRVNMPAKVLVAFY